VYGALQMRAGGDTLAGHIVKPKRKTFVQRVKSTSMWGRKTTKGSRKGSDKKKTLSQRLTRGSSTVSRKSLGDAVIPDAEYALDISSANYLEKFDHRWACPHASVPRSFCRLFAKLTIVWNMMVHLKGLIGDRDEARGVMDYLISKVCPRLASASHRVQVEGLKRDSENRKKAHKMDTPKDTDKMQRNVTKLDNATSNFNEAHDIASTELTRGPSSFGSALAHSLIQCCGTA
jgi:hypothetical protein